METAPVLRASRLEAAGFAHGFSTREGGVSDGPYASLNLGRAVGDDPERVKTNHARVANAIGYAPEQLFEASQVHGSDVIIVRGHDVAESIRQQNADALVTDRPGVAVGVRTADCVPILIGDRRTGRVAAVHAGWRGVVVNVAAAAMKALATEDASGCIAAIGPSIGPCCFEVGDDVAAQLGQAGGDGIVLRRGPSKPHVDLWRAIEHQLHRAGIQTIDTLGRCTMCEKDLFFSYRRDGAKSGRMLAAIVARSP